ncbi:unnamed protein product [Ambrosiozyma monospora]|uniref:Unnamed protein product n=1 Tax=Ambrosiozyma monospora TaxID=43982 RepID=A0A9W6YUL7_AMBMO|nr:unnamed protein product [Ambrosiozyma monospora]
MKLPGILVSSSSTPSPSPSQINSFPFFHLLFQHSNTDGIPVCKYLQLDENGRLPELEKLIDSSPDIWFNFHDFWLSMEPSGAPSALPNIAISRGPKLCIYKNIITYLASWLTLTSTGFPLVTDNSTFMADQYSDLLKTAPLLSSPICQRSTPH